MGREELGLKFEERGWQRYSAVSKEKKKRLRKPLFVTGHRT